MGRHRRIRTTSAPLRRGHRLTSARTSGYAGTATGIRPEPHPSRPDPPLVPGGWRMLRWLAGRGHPMPSGPWIWHSRAPHSAGPAPDRSPLSSLAIGVPPPPAGHSGTSGNDDASWHCRHPVFLAGGGAMDRNLAKARLASRHPPVYAGHYRWNAAPFGKFKAFMTERVGVPAHLPQPAYRSARIRCSRRCLKAGSMSTWSGACRSWQAPRRSRSPMPASPGRRCGRRPAKHSAKANR